MQRFCTRFLNPLTLRHAYPPLILYSTETTTSPSIDSFVDYLVNSLGFSPQQALAASKRLSSQRKLNDFNFKPNAISVVGFLKSRGFDDTHLRRIVSRFPKLLCSNVENTLRPKLQLLQDQGFLESDIFQVVYARPSLLFSGKESSILPALQVLRKIMGSDTHVIAILKNAWSNISETKYLIPNVELLTSHGTPIELIRKHLLLHPRPYTRKPEIFEDILSRVENKLGIRPNSPMFLPGLNLVCEHSEEAIESKCRMFKSFGWTLSDIHTLMMKNPSCFKCSDAAIEKKLNFLMKELSLEPGYLTSKCPLFTYSLEKRIVPRHKILLILKEKGLLEKNPSRYSAFCMSESRFLNKFVLPFKEIHEVYAELTGWSLKILA